MKVVTEATINMLVKQGKSEIYIGDDTIITPSARDRLRSRKITVICSQEGLSANPSQSTDSGKEERPMKRQNIDEKDIDKLKADSGGYIDDVTGGIFSEKPEHMTTIGGNRLVYKNDRRIIFRGKIDSFIANLLLTMEALVPTKNQEFTSDIESILGGMKKMQYAEISGNKLEDVSFLNYSYSEVRDRSHHPMKHYNQEHLFIMDYTYPRPMLKLNLLRAMSRELEIIGFDTYFRNGSVEREDIVLFLNRLSSAVYLLEIKTMAGLYDG